MRCYKCAGQKRVLGIGHMEDDCPVCKGLGTIEDDLIKAEFSDEKCCMPLESQTNQQKKSSRNPVKKELQ